MAQHKAEYITTAGDEWDYIAHKVYADRYRGEMLVHLLIDANPQHRETVIFDSGVRLAVPPAPEAAVSTLPPWKRQ